MYVCTCTRYWKGSRCALIPGNVRLDARSARRLLVTASVVPISPILVTVMKETLSSSKTSVVTRITRHNISCRRVVLVYDWRSVLVSWCRAPSRAHDQIVVNCLTVAVLSCSCALSEERSGLSFVSHSPKSWSICTWTIQVFSRFTCIIYIIYTIYT
jgi:hypothetical protein